MKTIQENSAGAVIYYYNETTQQPYFLLLRNTLKKTYWGFPKGKIEKNESIKQTVKREVKEETNISKIRILPKFKYEMRWFYQLHGNRIKKHAIFLIAEVNEKQKAKAKINHENEQLVWMSYEKALKTINIKKNKELLTKAYKFIKENRKQKTLF